VDLLKEYWKKKKLKKKEKCPAPEQKETLKKRKIKMKYMEFGKDFPSGQIGTSTQHTHHRHGTVAQTRDRGVTN